VAELPNDAPPEQAKKIANWITGELARIQHERGESLVDLKPAPAHFGQLVALIDAGTISSKLAKDVFESMYETGKDPASIVAESGQTQISDAGELRTIVEQVIGDQPTAVQDFRDGKDSAIKFLVGQVMRATRGRANPQTATELLKSALDALDS
jgi:aspartyl-tRNA(Asn)/glutamyl-tRNA(Gln) amidotransferase subunit B